MPGRQGVVRLGVGLLLGLALLASDTGNQVAPRVEAMARANGLAQEPITVGGRVWHPARVSAPVVVVARVVAKAPVAVKPVNASCGYLIDVNLSKQALVASRCGRVFLTTLITSGRAWRPQPRGLFHIYKKVSNVTFYSPFRGRDYYPPTHIHYAMEWADMYYLHTWVEPNSAFGPGSQNGPYASLGCIQVPNGAMKSLYNWAPIGTSVYIHY
jgi:hypothetical protein